MNQKAMKRSRQLLSIVIVFFWASEYAHVPYFAPYLNTLGFAASMIGIMTGTYGLTQTIIRIPLGMVTDMTSGYRKVVITGTVFTTLSSFGLIFAKSAWLIIFCRFLAGVAASTWLAFSVLYSAYYSAEEGVDAMTNINVFNNAGKLIAFVLGMIVATFWGYKYPLIISFLTGVVAIIFALTLKEVPIKNEPMKFSVLFQTFKNPYILVPSAYAILMNGIIQGTTFSFTSSAAEAIGAGKLEIGINTALYTVIQVLAGSFITKRLAKKLDDKWSVFLGFGLLGSSCLIIGFADKMWMFYLSQIIGGIGNILLISLFMAMVIRTVPMERKSTAMGLFQALYGIGMTLGPIIMGRVIESGSYAKAYYISAIICLLAMLSALIVIPMLTKKTVK